MDTEARAQKIRLLVCDVDGVLTDGQLLFGPDGEALKVFHARDGLGFTAAHRVGLKTALLTGRQSEMVRRRGMELSITEISQGAADKVARLGELAERHEITLAEIGYIGDDLNDLAVMEQVGLACAVADAADEVRTAAHFVTLRGGGHGAVREVIELVLKAQGKWDAVVRSFSQPGGGVPQQ